MGQKVNPIGFRTAVHKEWKSRWFADKKSFGEMLHEDLLIRKIIDKNLKEAGISDVIIERHQNRVRIKIFSARPGILIGHKGEGTDAVRKQITEATGKDVYIDIQEVRNPDTNAQLVAESIASQLERRIAFRRAMKRAMQLAMDTGALGIRVQACGRLGGAELARTEHYMQGKVPLQTLREDVQYGFAEAHTMVGKIGVKCWICQNPDGAEIAAARPGRKERSHGAHA